MKVYEYKTIRGTMGEVVTKLNEASKLGWENCGGMTGEAGGYVFILVKKQLKNG